MLFGGVTTNPPSAVGSSHSKRHLHHAAQTLVLDVGSMNALPMTLALGPTDVGLLRGMLAMFSEAFDDPEAYVRNPPTDAYLSRLLQSEALLAVAAVTEGRVVGGLAGYVLPKFEQERSEFYIYDLAVAKACRRRGGHCAHSTAGAGVHCMACLRRCISCMIRPIA